MLFAMGQGFRSMRLLAALVSGLLFGTGIALSGMINPAKVLNFFDVAGTWDPSLIFVMGGGLLVALIGYRIVFAASPRPLFDNNFHLSAAKSINIPLVAGSAVFGIGWGLSGFCPGGSIPALGLGESSAYVFVGAMIVGLASAKWFRLRQQT